jgi:hypothetical protein
MTFNSITVLALTTLFVSISAKADTPTFEVGETEEKLDCPVSGPFDPKCSKRILQLVAQAKVLTVQTEGGVTFSNDSGTGGAIKFSAQVINAETKSGDGQLLAFDAAYLGNGDSKTFRVRFTLADLEAIYICEDTENGGVSIPIFNADTSCKLHGVWSYIGFGGKLFEVQKDTATARLAFRWAEIHAVLNILGNSNEKDYLRRHFTLYAGTSLDTISYRQTPGAQGANTLPRGNFGVTGFLRSQDNLWEVRGLAGYRPNFKDFSDFSVEARLQALHNVLIGPESLLQLGLDTRYQYNTVPANSFGDFVSDRDHHSLFVGAVLGFYFK